MPFISPSRTKTIPRLQKPPGRTRFIFQFPTNYTMSIDALLLSPVKVDPNDSLYLSFLDQCREVLNRSSPGSFFSDLLKMDPKSKLAASRVCNHPSCNKTVRSKKKCKKHGGGRLCAVQGCKKGNQGYGRCISHGGGKRCKVDGCFNSVQTRGLCKSHGGGARCKVEGCFKYNQGKGFCRAHGGGKQCATTGCSRGSVRGPYCESHSIFHLCRDSGCSRIGRNRSGYCGYHDGRRFLDLLP